MSAGIAHEINNPLAIISGSVGLLSKFIDNPEKFAAKIQSIQKSCDRIARIVTGLQKFSRSGDKRNFELKELASLVNEAMVLTESKSKRHSTPVTIDCKTQAKIKCDEVEIEQVLVNLINNAIDAIKSQAQKWVTISISEQGANVVLRVMDSGPGIPESVRSKLFEPFFTTKKVGQGTGLGLSIAKGTLDEHQASITIDDKFPNTCFEIRFPKAEGVQNAA
jgi:C4-dicarboxylate-specific signal transduction histidine kinase